MLVFESYWRLRRIVWISVVNPFSEELNWSTSSITTMLCCCWRTFVAAAYSAVDSLAPARALPLRALATRRETSSSSTEVRLKRATYWPVFFSVTSWRRLSAKLRTSVNVIALYIYIWNSSDLPWSESLRRVCKIWLSVEVLPVPGCPQR